MDIQFRCTSVSHYDDRKGAYHKCNQLLQASSEDVGLKVRCPRCNQMTAVPVQQQAGQRSGSVPASESSAGGESVAKVESTMSYGKYSKRTNCPKCGTRLDQEKKCKTCGYRAPIVKASKRPIEKMEVKTAGFQLWFTRIMSDGVGIKVFEAVLHSFWLLVVLGLILFALLIGGGAAIWIVLAAIVLGFMYALLVYQTKRLATVPCAQLPFYLKPLWLFVLYLARAQKWTKYDSRLKGRIVIDVRGQSFGDRELLDLEKLNVCQVLDAQGTDITDNALAAMHGLKHLQCLVIRKTHVSNEAVFRLQQSLPQCWIWH